MYKLIIYLVVSFFQIFAASENNVPLVQSAVEIESELKIEYRNTLFIDEYQIRLPLMMVVGRRRGKDVLANDFINRYILILDVLSK